MKVTFKLRRGQRIATILIELRSRDIRIRKSTNLYFSVTSAKYWNKTSGRIKIPNDIVDANKINKKLNEFSERINLGFENMINDGTLNKANCEDLVEEVIMKDYNYKPESTVNPKFYLLNYFDYYMDFYEKNPSVSTGKRLTKGTLRTYKNIRNYIKRYLENRKIDPLEFTFDDINKEFYYDIIAFGEEKQYETNYIGSAIQKLITILNAAYEEGIHTNSEHMKKYFKKLTQSVDAVYLTTEEIIKIKNTNLKTEFEKDCRDVFLIGCYTGMRVGDLFKFVNNYDESKMNFKNVSDYQFKQNKTSNPAIIKVSDELLEILKNRKFKLPNITDINKFNEYVKIICKRAGIKTLITKKTSKGFETKPKYKLISSHTARRSFCTNAFLLGVPIQVIMTYSGHKSEKVFLEYVKSSALEKAKHFGTYDLLGINKKAS